MKGGSQNSQNPQKARARGTAVYEQLCADVAELAPAGLGAWPRTWELVAPADRDFTAAVSAWERDPTPAGLEQVRVTYLALIAAWKSAVSAWRALGANR